MLPSMSNQQAITEFLMRTDPPLLGVVGTVNPDGSPHVVPLWYRYDGSKIFLWTLEGRRWVKNLQNEPRVSLSIQEDEEPFGGVVIKGRAQVDTSDDAWISEEIRTITRNYIPEDGIEDYIAGWPELRTIVTITPEKMTSWGDGY